MPSMQGFSETLFLLLWIPALLYGALRRLFKIIYQSEANTEAAFWCQGTDRHEITVKFVLF